MQRDKEFDHIFNECLERLLIYGETVEQCTASYPGYSRELEPLLRTALASQQASAVQPRLEYKARARYQFQAALDEATTRRGISLFQWQPRWLTAVVVTAVLLVAGGSTVAAASTSMPRSPLYAVKLATEQVQMAFTFTDMGKAELYARLADKRVDEIVYLVESGDSAQVASAAERLNGYLGAMTSLFYPVTQENEAMLSRPSLAVPPAADEIPEDSKVAGGQYGQDGNDSGLRGLINQYASEHTAALRAALDAAPESARLSLQQAIDTAEDAYQQVLLALD